jgi:hypothetical protein
MRRRAMVVLAGLISACSPSTGVIYNHYVYPSYRPDDIAFAGASGQLWTEVLGNPFAVPKPVFDKAVTRAMHGAHFGPATDFTTTPTRGLSRTYHVRLMFNANALRRGTTYAPAIRPSCLRRRRVARSRFRLGSARTIWA